MASWVEESIHLIRLGHSIFLCFPSPLRHSSFMQVRGIWRVPVDGGEEIQVLDRGEMGHWVLTSRGISMLADRAIKFYGFATRQWTTIKEFSIDVTLDDADTSFTVSPDDRWILDTQLDNAGSDLMENYR